VAILTLALTLTTTPRPIAGPQSVPAPIYSYITLLSNRILFLHPILFPDPVLFLATPVQVKQTGCVSHMIFDIPTQLMYINQLVPLLPGTLTSA
jgi:2-keto-4-pentenoate hydratase/2-oxohepta-3-ene-1,7-dioic acid hydratase in catechol pathway